MSITNKSPKVVRNYNDLAIKIDSSFLVPVLYFTKGVANIHEFEKSISRITEKLYVFMKYPASLMYV